MKSVNVLLSTYNGEKYIKQQLDSLLQQEGVDVFVTIRDDGSKDNTVNIVSDYQRRHANIELICGENAGAEASFNKLCLTANDSQREFDYYAFCDQDDVWLPNKLAKGVERIDAFDLDKPNLYFSNLQMVDQDLNPLRMLFEEGEVVVSKEMSLLQQFTYGCTCIFNRTALQHYSKSNSIIYHDNWIETICMFLGNVVYDEKSYVLYRQTGHNLSGKKKSGFGLFMQRFSKLLKPRFTPDFKHMAQEMLMHFDTELNDTDKSLLKLFAEYPTSFRKKLTLLTSDKYRVRSYSKDLSIKFRILFNVW